MCGVAVRIRRQNVILHSSPIDYDTQSGPIAVFFLIYINSMPHYTITLHASRNLRFSFTVTFTFNGNKTIVQVHYKVDNNILTSSLIINNLYILYGEVNSVKNTTINTWLNDGVYLRMEKIHVSAYSGHLQVLTTFLLKEFYIICLNRVVMLRSHHHFTCFC